MASLWTSRKIKVTILASEWGSSKGGLSTLNRELAIHLAKCPEVEITFFLPQCSQMDKKEAHENSVRIVETTCRPSFEQLEWLCFPPANLEIDVNAGHRVTLGKQAQVIKYLKNVSGFRLCIQNQRGLGCLKTTPTQFQRAKKSTRRK